MRTEGEDNGDKIKKYDVAYFMASVDPLDENIKFAKATSVTLGDRVARVLAGGGRGAPRGRPGAVHVGVEGQEIRNALLDEGERSAGGGEIRVEEGPPAEGAVEGCGPADLRSPAQGRYDQFRGVANAGLKA